MGRRVIAIDRSADVLDRARALARRRGVSNIRWEQRGVGARAARDRSVDVTLLSQALHHATDPARALAEGADHPARRSRAGARSAPS